MTKAKLAKSKLAKALSNDKHADRKNRYWPTTEEAVRWHRTINREVFGKELREDTKIEVRRRHGCYGECWGYVKNDEYVVSISFNHWFLSKKHFIECVVHEMVHQYQWEKLNEMTHGESFYAWQPKLQKYGMTLKEKQK